MEHIRKQGENKEEPEPERRTEWEETTSFMNIFDDLDIPSTSVETLSTWLHYFRTSLDQAAFFVITDERGTIKYASPSFCGRLKFQKEALLGEDYISLKKMFYNDRDKHLLQEAIEKGYEKTVETVQKTNRGDMLSLRIVVVPVRLSGRDFRIILHHDETHEQRMLDEMEKLQHIDFMTNLPNRAKFERDVKGSLQNEDQDHFALFFIDVDRFKFFNDTLGHYIGDQLILRIANTLNTLANDQVTVYRYGGDEFVLYMAYPNDKKHVDEMAKQIIEMFQKPFVVEGHELHLSASIGVTCYPDYGLEFDELVHQSDTAMQYAKETGKNHYQYFSSTLKTAHSEKLKIEKQLRKAVDYGNFELYFQPQIDLSQKEVFGVEALLRWNDPTLGNISPGQFIPIAEETGLIIPMGDWVIEQACQKAKQWVDRGLFNIQMAINISPLQFQRPDFVEKIRHVLRKTGLPPSYLDLEITENDLIYDREESFHTLERLKELGIRISIDDFGTGYSSFSYLKHFPIDTLKIDQSFIKDLTSNPQDQAIVTSIIDLAQNMNLRVIAEGVETEDIVRFLNERNCYEMQGFLYSKPLPEKDLERFMLRRENWFATL
ncbi:EAL domain-containing protein [Texcoconibacillus texcoconensis]|uniref:EAL domain-containing protein n=1 Tax=Texcoconibacillus texcoconensis TaxID=1095777 RepID=UPI0016215FCB